MQFPHLTNSNAFPGINSVNPYKQYENTFDYNRWEANTRITLLNVPWDADGRNVVKFKTNTERDAWFSAQASESITLQAMTRREPDGSIKLPIPFDELCRYNYIVVDFGTATSSANPIAYETTQGVNKRFYFVQETRSLAPSTTMATLQEDWWTTFINDASIPMLMLERGHLPVAASNVSDYLSNPMTNNTYLLGEDVNYGDITRVQSTVTVPINAGDKYACIVVPFTLAQFAVSTAGTTTGGGTAPKFSTVDVKNGYLAQMSANYGVYGIDYSNSTVPNSIVQSQDGIIYNNTSVLAVKASEFYTFMAYLADNMAFIVTRIRACFVIGSDCITLGNSEVIGNITVYSVSAKNGYIKDIELTPEMFNIPKPFDSLAKLYTSPYSMLELQQPDGTSVPIAVENTGNLEIVQETSLIFPFLNIQTALTGVGGSGLSQYNISTVTGGTTNGSAFNDDALELLNSYDIPCFSVNLSTRAEASISGSIDMKIAERNAKTAYGNSVRSTNTTYNNSVASSNQAYTNTVNTNATSVTNTNASTAMSVTNTALSGTTQQSNQTTNNNNATNNTNLSNAFNNTMTSESNRVNRQVLSLNLELQNLNLAQDNSASWNSTQADNQAMAATTAANGMTNFGASLVGAAASGATGNVAGAAMGVISAAVTGISAAVASSNCNIAMNAAESKVDIVTQANNKKQENNVEKTHDVQDETNNFNTYQTTQRNTLATAINNNNCSTGTTITNRNVSTNNTIATNNKSVTDANASRTQTTSNANALASRDVSNTNSGDSRDVSIWAQQQSALTDYANKVAEQQKARLNAPIQYGAQQGNATYEADKRNALQVRVRTQSDSALYQAGSYFSRYGYAWAGMVDLSNIDDLIQMPNFTYWKASEVWINGDMIIESARDYIESVLMAGTTVWRNPDEIGKVAPYAQL